MFQTRAFDCHVEPQLTNKGNFKSETIWAENWGRKLSTLNIDVGGFMLIHDIFFMKTFKMLLTGRHFPFLQHSWNKERPGWLLYCCSWSLLIALFTIERFLEVAIKGWPKWDFNTYGHSIPFRRSNRLISTSTQSQLCTTTPISSFV